MKDRTGDQTGLGATGTGSMNDGSRLNASHAKISDQFWHTVRVAPHAGSVAGASWNLSLRKMRCTCRPSRAPSKAVARQWLDCTPPQVIMVSQFCSRTRARVNSSLRILLPLTPQSVRSSRLTQILGPPSCSDNLSSVWKGVGRRASDRRGGEIMLSNLPSLLRCAIHPDPKYRRIQAASALKTGPLPARWP